MSEVITVLTFNSAEKILAVGGTQSWALNKRRAQNCKYIVICRNAPSVSVEGHEKHGHAFMVGKIKDIIPSTETKGKWLIRISEYAEADFDEQWEGNRKNPVKYWDESQYRGSKDWKPIDFEKISFTPMPQPSRVKAAISAGMTINDAKEGLALTFGVDPSAIDITIRA